MHLKNNCILKFGLLSVHEKYLGSEVIFLEQ